MRSKFEGLLKNLAWSTRIVSNSKVSKDEKEEIGVHAKIKQLERTLSKLSNRHRDTFYF